GQGWETGETREIRYSEGEAAFSEMSVNQRIIRQTISASEHLGGLVFASGTLVTVNRDFVVAWRDSGDEMVDQFGGLQKETRYQVDSSVAAYSASQLKQSDGNFPGWTKKAYLSLPDTLPDRVVQLAHQLVENQSNPYDKALAIEKYLRTYPYNLNIEAPPAGKDVADYFLFELRQGYCDYYATAMVVLARTVGLPARLAVGYASGLYDQANQRYIVTAADAHSWVEIYFPEFGWIPFEPTAGQPALEREEFLPEFPPDMDGKLSPFPSKWARFVRLGSILLGGGISLLIIAFVIWWEMDMWLLSRKPPLEAITIIFQHIYRFGRRFGFATGSKLTPYEYTARLNLSIAGLISASSQKPTKISLYEKLRKITDIYVKSIYGPEVPDIRVQKEAVQIWKTLRLQFWWLWLRSRLATSIEFNLKLEDTPKRGLH
ncbi:MAG TPA: transglutaminase-like domain-containing protein, partial [Anaerolineales bacterium]